jgi:hypothetical protein
MKGFVFTYVNKDTNPIDKEFFFNLCKEYFLVPIYLTFDEKSSQTFFVTETFGCLELFGQVGDRGLSENYTEFSIENWG